MTHCSGPLPFDDRDDLIKQDKLLQFFELAPEFATILGYHALDDRLPQVDDAAFQAEYRFVADWLEELRRLPREQLTTDQRLDLALFEHCHGLHRFYFHELDLWRRSPEAVAEVGQILFMTLQYQTDDEAERFTHIAARLEAVPRYIQQHQSRTQPPPRRWRDVAIQTTEGMLPFFDAMAAAAAIQVPGTLAERVAAGARLAKQEAARYIDWLKGLTVDERELWVLGPDRFTELLRLRKLGLDAQEILELGTAALARYEVERQRLATELVGSADVAAARAKVEADAPPDFAAALEATRRACAEAKAFLQQHHLVDLPDASQERLDVIETPPFLRPLIPFAAIFPPARFAPIQHGTYMVTPPSDPQHLARQLNYTGIYNTAVHEAYPGHHLQLSTANLTCTFLRSATFIGGKSAELVEGWAHYCEELMKDRGFHDTVAGRFVMVNDLVWRAARVIIDVKLSRGEMSFDEGVAFLRAHTDIPEAAAIAEMNRYTHSPTYQLSYLIGKHLILDLKRAVQAREGAGFSEAAFHNQLLRAGSIPVSVIRREMFGVVP